MPLDEKTIRHLSYVSFFIGGASFVLLSLNTLVGFYPHFIGFLPLRFAWLIVLSVLFLPVYWRVLTRPQEADISFFYRIVYAHNLLFILGFILFYLWF